MSGHTITLDIADARERDVLDRLLAACDPGDRIAFEFQGDQVTIVLGR